MDENVFIGAPVQEASRGGGSVEILIDEATLTQPQQIPRTPLMDKRLDELKGARGGHINREILGQL